MTTARCFGGVLDGTWRAIDGREIIAPAPDMLAAQYIGPNDALPDPWDLLAPSFPTHRYTLQKFVTGVGAVTRETLWGDYREPIIFHALIGPGFTVAMVKAWLDGWMEEAERIEKSGSWYYWERYHNKGGTVDHDAEKARTVIAQMERRLGNQKATIDGLQRDVDRVQTQNRQLAVDLRDAQADLRSIRTVRDNAVAAQVRIREKMQEHLRARIKAENSLTEARRQRGAQARRAERAEAAIATADDFFYGKARVEALHRMLDGAQEDRQQLQEQRDFFKTRLNAAMDETRVSIRRLTSERDEARERCNNAVSIGRRLLDQGRTFAAVHRMIDALFGR